MTKPKNQNEERRGERRRQEEREREREREQREEGQISIEGREGGVVAFVFTLLLSVDRWCILFRSEPGE